MISNPEKQLSPNGDRQPPSQSAAVRPKQHLPGGDRQPPSQSAAVRQQLQPGGNQHLLSHPSAVGQQIWPGADQQLLSPHGDESDTDNLRNALRAYGSNETGLNLPSSEVFVLQDDAGSDTTGNYHMEEPREPPEWRTERRIPFGNILMEEWVESSGEEFDFFSELDAALSETREA